jgi:transcriptional regulator with GAF, ATPase, and Fis domain
MQRLLHMLPDVARSEATVVLEGESGTGKDLFAQAIHLRSPRAAGPFVAFSCSALVETLIESELFGHVKGAFTGAISHKVGRFEMAKGGTLFLDEIGELKLELQAKLLRVLESKVFEPVGSSRPIPMEARIIAATSRNLVEEVRRGRFRMDLLYRLRTVPFYLPPLRDRQADIPLLVNHCLVRLNRKYGKDVRGVDPKVMSLFQNYAWPGNIRELERVLEYAFVFVKGAVITKDVPKYEQYYYSPYGNGYTMPQMMQNGTQQQEVGAGTGLGLWICYQVVRKHGGQIHIESTPNEGAAVVIDLPRKLAAPEVPAAPRLADRWRHIFAKH